MNTVQEEFVATEHQLEHELLLAVASGGRSDGIRSLGDLVRQEGLDWAYVRRQAHMHGLFVLLQSALDTIESGRIPADMLRRFRLEQGALQLAVDASVNELEALAKTFEDASVPMLSFKGVVLAKRAYNDVYLRPAGDIDLLVRSEDSLRAFDLIAARGYRAYDSSKQDERITSAALESHLKTYKGVTFIAGRGSIDLHATLDDPPYRVGLSTDDIWRRSVSVELRTRSVRAMADEDLLRYLCFHAAKHGWLKFSWVVDIGRLVESSPTLDWPDVLGRSKGSCSERVLSLGLFLASRLLGVLLPKMAENFVVRDSKIPQLARVVAGNFIGGPETKDIKKLRARLFSSPKERLAYVRHRLLRRYGLSVFSG